MEPANPNPGKRKRPSDWNKANGRFNTAAKKAADRRRECQQNHGRLGHTQIVAGWLPDSAVSSVFTSLTHKGDRWPEGHQERQLGVLERISETWSEEEIEMHLATGRIVTRECPDPAGV